MIPEFMPNPPRFPRTPEIRRLTAQYGDRLERLSNRVKWLLIAGFSVHAATWLGTDSEFIDLSQITEFIAGFASLSNQDRGDLQFIFGELENLTESQIAALIEALSAQIKWEV